jgi:phosphopantothenoylcysteine decarboxylase/phosphopantothenate--cysteine ligase
MAAAVADFRPATVADRKIKKSDDLTHLVLEPTHDFLVDLGEAKPPGQTLVGFAAESDDLRANARGKLERKRLDLIVANDISAPGVGFEHDTNQVVIIDAAGVDHDVPLSDKRAIADAVLDAVVAWRADEGATTPSTGFDSDTGTEQENL